MKILYQSDFCTVTNFLCECTDCAISRVEYQDRLSFCFVRSGNFLFKAFRNDLDAYTGRILVNKPGYEYRIGHLHTVPDQCTLFTFSPEACDQFVELYSNALGGFLENPDIQSVLVKSSAAIDYLHAQIFRSLQRVSTTELDTDCALMELVERVFMIDRPERSFQEAPRRNKGHYLQGIERAKEFIHSNFSEKISLNDIASETAMSPFHFARLFRQIAEVSPYQYVTDFRTSHAEYLLRHSDLPISDISYLAGFNSPSHFSTAFKAKNKRQPSAYRST